MTSLDPMRESARLLYEKLSNSHYEVWSPGFSRLAHENRLKPGLQTGHQKRKSLKNENCYEKLDGPPENVEMIAIPWAIVTAAPKPSRVSNENEFQISSPFGLVRTRDFFLGARLRST